jgi:ankyrin repeat protein
LAGILADKREAVAFLLRRNSAIMCSARRKSRKRTLDLQKLFVAGEVVYERYPDVLKVNAKGRDKLCALRHAASKGWWDIVAQLRQSGATIESALLAEQASGGRRQNPDPASLLLLDSQGKTFLHDIAQSRAPTCSEHEAMLDLTADVCELARRDGGGAVLAKLLFKKDNQQRNPLHWACAYGRPRLVEKLIEEAGESISDKLIIGKKSQMLSLLIIRIAMA